MMLKVRLCVVCGRDMDDFLKSQKIISMYHQEIKLQDKKENLTFFFYFF